MSHVRYERDGPVARITLARPEAGNAVSLDVACELRRAAAVCARDATIRALLIAAEGKAFCVGGDLAAFLAVTGPERAGLLKRMADEFHAAQLEILTMAKPVVVAVQGAVAGAGLGLALLGDVVLASTSAHFTSAYAAVGLSADGGSTYLLPRLVGLRRAQQLLFTDRRLSATEARDWGLVTEVVEPHALAEVAADQVRKLANGPTAAYGAIRRLLFQSATAGFQAQTDAEAVHIARLSAGVDASEGFAAFREKRMPVFTGSDPE